MKLTEWREVDENGYEYHGKGAITIKAEDDRGGSVSLEIRAGEPEDAVFYRDLNGAYSISHAIRLAYEAGKRGETLEYELVKNEEEAV
ncbi:hypothetical protein [Paenibacillus sp. UASWS1643]|uniref:hypothetical protein n=1 Tax=Paenibacillus sp. UASWS1643 TaxID=2580422 RepID=UPI00123C75E7|nr:hypothetical protein [Paenibacillus sp. UASWS1643]KAA8750177.1 hypothetical protein FE296_16420 [Paenibacillus sp. UASWS1643]